MFLQSQAFLTEKKVLNKTEFRNLALKKAKLATFTTTAYWSNLTNVAPNLTNVVTEKY